ncbi:MAG: T9SS type A sorting domain-containing protein [Crocinitomicaceae bacterium]|nr:T9SS type A sorting domain-containing protein [Crocinitomicaceae bacterium]
MKLISSTLLFILFFSNNLFGQQAIVPSGGDHSGSGGSISFSLGQSSYTTNNAASGESSAEGVQHAYEIYAYSTVNELNSTININISPNPTSDILNLTINDFESYSYSLYELNGKLLNSNKIINENTNLNLQNLARSTYILKVFKKNQFIKSFKIIKN